MCESIVQRGPCALGRKGGGGGGGGRWNQEQTN